jgi:hypothetical protein
MALATAGGGDQVHAIGLGADMFRFEMGVGPELDPCYLAID